MQGRLTRLQVLLAGCWLDKQGFIEANEGTGWNRSKIIIVAVTGNLHFEFCFHTSNFLRPQIIHQAKRSKDLLVLCIAIVCNPCQLHCSVFTFSALHLFLCELCVSANRWWFIKGRPSMKYEAVWSSASEIIFLWHLIAITIERLLHVRGAILWLGLNSKASYLQVICTN